ncbi:MAG: phosphatase PAP2 family protein [Rhodospirillales bacterium]
MIQAPHRRALSTRPYLASFLAAAALTLLSIAFFDRPVLAWAQSLTPETRAVFRQAARLSAPEIWMPMFILGAGIFYWLRRQGRAGAGRWFHACAFAAVSCFAAGAALHAAKWIFGRPRPKVYIGEGAYGFDFFTPLDSAMNALPSGHTQAAFTFAVVLAFLWPRYDWLWLCFGVLIAACRVMNMDHWLADVIAGAWLGAVAPVALAAWMAGRGTPVRLGGEGGAVMRLGRVLRGGG